MLIKQTSFTIEVDEKTFGREYDKCKRCGDNGDNCILYKIPTHTTNEVWICQNCLNELEDAIEITKEMEKVFDYNLPF